MKSGKVGLKTVIVMTILALVGVLSFLGMGAAKTYLSGASAGSEPKSVLATPSDDGKSVTISWQTDKSVQAVVEYGTTPASLLLRSLESDSSTSHKISISPLKGGTSYYFRIRVGEEVYDNSGIPFSFKTKGAGGGTGIPSINPQVTLVATPSLINGCARNVDYNNDNVVNSLDYIKCMSGGKGTVSPTKVVMITPIVTSGGCRIDVDYDKNGSVNSLDRIKCLQNK
ncbi:fibronectin type III domain-containing protein [Candidatus Shapirobacteria bacterium]|nr:fibronectin type III domain-containing protein [Candidatus Shapirobacteria bacterium]